MSKIILSILLVMLILPSVSAFEFDNVKQYNPGTETAIIKNSFLGIPTSEVAELKLATPRFNIVFGEGYQRVAEIDINSYEDYANALKSIEFYDVSTGKLIDNALFDYKYKKTDLVEYPVYSWSCVNQTVNGDIKPVCTKGKQIGTETRPVYSWINMSKDITKGSFTLGIYYNDVKPGQVIEWIPTFYGIKIPEWASFTGSTKYEFYQPAIPTDDYFPVTSGRRGGQTFTIGTTGSNVTFILSGISVFLRRPGSSPQLTPIGIYNFSGGATQQGQLLTLNSTFNATQEMPDGAGWNNVNISFQPITLQNGTSYAYLFNNSVGGQFDHSSSTLQGYTGGTTIDDGTGSLVAKGDDDWFQIYGYIVVVGTNTVNLVSPVNDYNSTSSSVIFNCTSGGAPTNISNMSLWINGVVNYSVSANSNLSELYTTVTNIPDGKYNWTCSATDLLNTRYFASANRTFTVDTIAPVINILYPQNSTSFASQGNLSFQFNVSVTHIPGALSCYYSNGTANYSIACNSNTTINLSTNQGGYTTLIYYANDSLGNMASNSTTIFYNAISQLVNYTGSVVEGETTKIYLNLTANRITTAYANLTYNNTIYSMSQLFNNGTTVEFYSSIVAPFVDANSLMNFSFNYSIDGLLLNTSYYNQTVYNVPALNVSAGLCNANPVYAFDFKDEENGTALVGDLEYNFYYGLSNATLVRSFGRLTSTSNFSVCTNSTISPNWTIGSGEIFYNVPGYAERRYYIFDNTVVTNMTNITLYDLLNTAQTSFKLEVEDTSLNPYDNVYNRLLRWYPDQNEYKIVDMGKTDETGSTVIHVKSEDVDYRIGVYETNGTLIYLAQPIRMVCLASPCTYTLKISPGNTDYTSFLNVVYSLDYNETSGIWDFVYSDSTGRTSTMNLTVYRVTSTSVYPVCSNSITGAVGAISCNTSIFTDGMLRAEVYRSASPPVQIVQKVIQLYNSAFKGSGFGLFLSFLLGLPIILLLTMVSPIGAIVGGVISLIPAFYFGSINIGILGGIAVLAGITAHFLKRVS